MIEKKENNTQLPVEQIMELIRTNISRKPKPPYFR